MLVNMKSAVVMMLLTVSSVYCLHAKTDNTVTADDRLDRVMPVDNKALFTLGALAVLGGASFFIGKNTGMQHAQKYGMGGYGMYDPYMYGSSSMYGHYPTMYGSYPSYYGYSYRPAFKGVQAGFYARPMVGRRRRAVAESPDKDPEGPTLIERQVRNAQDNFQNFLYSSQADRVSVIPKKDSESDQTSTVDQNILNPTLARSKRKAYNDRDLITSDRLHVADGLSHSRQEYRITNSSPKIYSPITSADRRPNSQVSENREPKNEASIVLDDERRPRYEPPKPMRPECIEPEGRNFEHLGIMMLENAFVEDEQGCGLSLLCEIGRLPIQQLPPKAIGLRQLLTGPKPRGLEGSLWSALTESLLMGLSGRNCAEGYPYCRSTPSQLMMVFASL